MKEVAFFYGGIEPIVRILVVGTLSYITLLILLRVSGKRTLARMTAFDFIITIAIGATFGRLMTAQGVSFAESITAFLLLISLQHLTAWIAVRSSRFEQLINSQPALLYFRGQFLHREMKRQRVTQTDILSILRQRKISSLENVEAIVLESAGTVAVIQKENVEPTNSLSSLRNIPQLKA
ncbi:MAG: DUF421 domain-containing protein [Elainellaceae cyanobacterium]